MNADERRKNSWRALLFALAALHGWSLMRFPAPFVDEVWVLARAWEFIHSGRVFSSLDAGVCDRFSGYWTYFPWLPTALQSLSLRFFPAPSLLAVRLVSLAAGAVLLAALYTIGRHWGGHALGLTAVTVTALSSPFLYSAHMGRYDILAAAFGWAAVALHLRATPRAVWVDALAGLCVVLALENHAHGAIFGLAMGALFLREHGRRVWREPRAWAFAAGAGAGLVGYAALHIWRYPETYAAISRLLYGPTHTPPLLTLNMAIIARAFADMGGVLVVAYGPLVALLAWGAFLCWSSPAGLKDPKSLLVLAAGLVLAHTLLIRNKHFYYTILTSPALDLLLAAFLVQFARRPWRGRIGDYASRALVWGACAGALALNLYPLQIDFYGVYQKTQARINEVVAPTDTVMGPQTYWLGLPDQTFYSWETLVFYQRYAPGSTLADALAEFRPDVFIVDGHLNSFIVDESDDSPYSQFLRLPRAELESFLTRHAVLLTEFDSGYYGEVRVYRILWK